MQESAPQGKPTKEDSTQAVFTVLTLSVFLSCTVPHSIAAENITIAVEPDTLHVLIYVSLIDEYITVTG